MDLEWMNDYQKKKKSAISQWRIVYLMAAQNFRSLKILSTV